MVLSIQRATGEVLVVSLDTLGYLNPVSPSFHSNHQILETIPVPLWSGQRPILHSLFLVLLCQHQFYLMQVRSGGWGGGLGVLYVVDKYLRT